MVDPFFARCCVVNLQRREDRLRDFEQRLAASDWPFDTPETFRAIDGQLCQPPKFWNSGKGAWGVMRSHLSLIEDSLNRGLRNVLILEDDATFVDGFAVECQTFLSEIPSDWEMLYLGGQHLFQDRNPPRKISQHVYQPYNVNRLHAFALSRRGMEIVYAHLNSRDWKDRHHIDHHLGRLHMGGGIKVYTPWRWLVGQAEGKSDIAGGRLDERFWKDARAITGEMSKVVAVLGPWRSGTSCVAGCLNALGIPMGGSYAHKPNANNPLGYFEDAELLKIGQRCFREPQMSAKNNRPERIALLKHWLQNRSPDAPLVGAKHASLCLMVPAMSKAWPGVKAVAVTRDVDVAAASLQKTGWWPNVPEEQKRKIIQNFLTHRDDDLRIMKVPHLDLRYPDLLTDPPATVQAIVDFLGLSVLGEVFRAAVEAIKPELNHAPTG